MIYTVTFNPSLDYVVNVPRLETGKVNRSVGESIIPGGKGINVSLVLNNLEIDNKALGFVAGFTGDTFISLLRDRNVNFDFIKLETSGRTRINVKINSIHETEINAQGPIIDTEAVNTLYEKLNYLDEEDYLVLAGSIPPSMSSSTYMDIMQQLDGLNVKVIVDATNDLLMNSLQYKPFLIKPNNHELGEIFNTKIETKEEAVIYAKMLQERGAINVLVSMADKGAVLVSENGNVYDANAPKGKVKNSVGAGDSMLAGFIAGYIETKSYEYALKLGICSGSASAFSEGMATKTEIMNLMKKY